MNSGSVSAGRVKRLPVLGLGVSQFHGKNKSSVVGCVSVSGVERELGYDFRVMRSDLLPAKLVTTVSGLALILSGISIGAFGLRFVLSAGFLSIGLIGIHYRQAHRHGVPGLVGTIMAVIGALTFVNFELIATIFPRWVASPRTSIFTLFLPALLIGLGMILLGITIVRGGIFPRRNGWFLIFGIILTLFTGPIGAIPFGISLVWIGYQQLTGRDITGRPLPV